MELKKGTKDLFGSQFLTVTQNIFFLKEKVFMSTNILFFLHIIKIYLNIGDIYKIEFLKIPNR